MQQCKHVADSTTCPPPRTAAAAAAGTTRRLATTPACETNNTLYCAHSVSRSIKQRRRRRRRRSRQSLAVSPLDSFQPMTCDSLYDARRIVSVPLTCQFL